MRHARRAIAILIGFAAGFIATATVAYASLSYRDGSLWYRDGAWAPAVPHTQFQGGGAALPSTSAAGLPLWQFLAFVALGVFLAVAIVGLGYSLSHSRRSQPSPRPQQPLPH
jgi:hypothetical protein